MDRDALAAQLAAAARSWGERGEVVLATGLAYRPEEPVVVRVQKRGHRYGLDDTGRAVALAGRPPGWLGVARDVVEEFWLNVNRAGLVRVGAVEGRDLAWLAGRVAEASIAVHQELLELDDR